MTVLPGTVTDWSVQNTNPDAVANRVVATSVCGVDEYPLYTVMVPRALEATLRWPVAGWVPIGLRRYALTPADSIGGSAMVLTGVTEPTPLVTDDQIMQFPNDYDTGVIELSKHILQLDEGGNIFAQASTGYQDFLRDAKSLSMFKNLKMPSYYTDQQLRK